MPVGVGVLVEQWVVDSEETVLLMDLEGGNMGVPVYGDIGVCVRNLVDGAVGGRVRVPVDESWGGGM